MRSIPACPRRHVQTASARIQEFLQPAPRVDRTGWRRLMFPGPGACSPPVKGLDTQKTTRRAPEKGWTFAARTPSVLLARMPNPIRCARDRVHRPGRLGKARAQPSRGTAPGRDTRGPAGGSCRRPLGGWRREEESRLRVRRGGCGGRHELSGYHVGSSGRGCRSPWRTRRVAVNCAGEQQGIQYSERGGYRRRSGFRGRDAGGACTTLDRGSRPACLRGAWGDR